MIKVAWAFPEERLISIKMIFDSIGMTKGNNSQHSFVSSSESLAVLNPDVIVTNQYDWVLDYTLTSGNVKWVHFMSSGIDKAIGILKRKISELVITNVRGIHSECMRNYVMSWILAESQNLIHYYDSQAKREWSRKRSISLEGRTIMIYGYGSIGQSIGSFARGIGMNVIGVKTEKPVIIKDNEQIITPSEAIRFTQKCDYFVSCVPLTHQTTSIFNTEFFDSFQLSPLFINVSRAETVDMSALKNALKNGNIRSAVLDVHDIEPLPVDSDAWSFRGLYLTPHVAGYTDSGLKLGIERFKTLLESFENSGIKMADQVSITKGY